METMERFAPLDSPVWASPRDGRDDDGPQIYQGVSLDGPDADKLAALCDALVFYCAVARLRTRPVTITEADGCVKIRWRN